MASLEKIQLMLDWHHDMVRCGKKVGQTFNMDMVDAYYRQVADRGSPLLPFQERKLDKIIRSFHVDVWAEENYPRLKGTGPAPPMEDDSSPFVDC